MPDPVTQRRAQQKAVVRDVREHRIDYVRFSGDSPGIGCMCGWEVRTRYIEEDWNQHKRDFGVRTK